MKVALVIESSNRQNEGPAYEFYTRGSRLIQSALNYLREIQFPDKDIYFLSFYQKRIIPYQDIVKDYPISPAPNRIQRNEFAEKIAAFLYERYSGAEVHLHVGKTITDHLVPILKTRNVSYVVYAEGEQLLRKAAVYEDMIQQERAMKRMKDIQREKEKMISIPEFFTPHEAEQIINEFGTVAHKYGVENKFSEIRHLLKDYKQQVRQAQAARREFETNMSVEDREALKGVFSRIRSLADLFHGSLTEFRSTHGKLTSQLTTYLIKEGYVKKTTNRISEELFLLQIALLKV